MAYTQRSTGKIIYKDIKTYNKHDENWNTQVDYEPHSTPVLLTYIFTRSSRHDVACLEFD